MLLQHELVVHLVHMVSGKQHDESGPVVFDDVDVLVDGIRGPKIPIGFGHTLAGRENVETFVPLRAKEIPTHLQVANKAVRLVLSGDRDATDSGIQSIRECKIDDARLSPEINGRFGAFVGQLQKPASASTCENEGKGMPRQRLVCDWSHFVLPMAHSKSEFWSCWRPSRRRSGLFVPVYLTLRGAPPKTRRYGLLMRFAAWRF